MKVSDAYPSKYLTSADLNGKTPRVTISHIEMEEVGKDKQVKPIVYFKSVKKGLVCNVTNARAIQASYGEEMDDWAGSELILFTVMTNNQQGETVEGLRVRAPQPKDNPKPTMTPSHPKRQVGGISDTISEDTDENPAPF